MKKYVLFGIAAILLVTLTGATLKGMPQENCAALAARMDGFVQKSVIPGINSSTMSIDPCTHVLADAYLYFDAVDRNVRIYFPWSGAISGFQYLGGTGPTYFDSFGGRVFRYNICKGGISSVFIEPKNERYVWRQIC